MNILYFLASLSSLVLTATKAVHSPLQEFIRGNLCIFETAPRTTFNRFILAALYPPVDQAASSCGYGCRTSLELSRISDGINNFLWCDLAPISPYAGTTCREQDMCGLLRFFQGRTPSSWDISANWWSRLEDLLVLEHDAGNSLPTCVWCGKIVDTARAWLFDSGLFALEIV